MTHEPAAQARSGGTSPAAISPIASPAAISTIASPASNHVGTHRYYSDGVFALTILAINVTVVSISMSYRLCWLSVLTQLGHAFEELGCCIQRANSDASKSLSKLVDLFFMRLINFRFYFILQIRFCIELSINSSLIRVQKPRRKRSNPVCSYRVLLSLVYPPTPTPHPHSHIHTVLCTLFAGPLVTFSFLLTSEN